MNMTYTFDQLRDALTECTSYDLQHYSDGEENGYALIDPFGDIDGDIFYDLDDVADFITNNEDVDAYLIEAAEYLRNGEN
jgi:hypothetical protein